jgi:Enoyl-CoA hydratase/isomerase
LSGENRGITVELRRPPNNFLDIELIGHLATALEGLDKNKEVRSIVLASAGKHFCAGANLIKRINDEAAGKKTTQPRHLYHETQRLVQTKKAHRRRTAWQCNWRRPGACAGGGFSCDVQRGTACSQFLFAGLSPRLWHDVYVAAHSRSSNGKVAVFDRQARARR